MPELFINSYVRVSKPTIVSTHFKGKGLLMQVSSLLV